MKMNRKDEIEDWKQLHQKCKQLSLNLKKYQNKILCEESLELAINTLIQLSHSCIENLSNSDIQYSDLNRIIDENTDMFFLVYEDTSIKMENLENQFQQLESI